MVGQSMFRDGFSKDREMLKATSSRSHDVENSLCQIWTPRALTRLVIMLCDILFKDREIENYEKTAA